MIRHIEPDGSGGWFITWEGGGHIWLNEAWLDEMWRHQIKPRKVNVPAFNRLRWVFGHGDVDQVAEAFTEAYGDILGNREARRNLGLKTVTRDGDEDLIAVQEGAEVRPWNAPVRPSNAEERKELHEWIRRQRDNRNP